VFIVVAEIKDIDLGWREIKKQLKLLNNSYTKIGIQGKKAEKKYPIKKNKTQGSKTKTTKKERATVAEVGLYNEFGTKNIPSRPFMRGSFEQHKKQVDLVKRSQYLKILDGKRTVKKALWVIGEFRTTKIKEKIRDLRTPPNAESTKKIKGSSNPLIDTGRMRASITHTEVLRGKEKEIINAKG